MNILNWYKTIDKIDPALRGKAKLLLVDIKKDQWAPLDLGEYYPHHNISHISGRSVHDLKILGSILMSKFFMEQLVSSSALMHGGYPRWQAQNVRRILVPTLDMLPNGMKKVLAECYDARDASRTNEIIDDYVSSTLLIRKDAIADPQHSSQTAKIKSQTSPIEA